MPNSIFTLSIEPTGKSAFIHGFHLGTDEALARQIAAEMFTARNARKDWTCTVALIRDRKIFDVFDGVWQSSWRSTAAKEE